MQVTATKDKEGWVRGYLTIWQGILSLTERELDLAVHIALRYLDLAPSVASEELLAELLLSPSAKLRIREALAAEDGTPMSANNLQNYLSSLKDKGVLVPVGNKLTLRPQLIPQTEIVFTFNVVE